MIRNFKVKAVFWGALIIGIILLSFSTLFVPFLSWLATQPAVPKNYTDVVKTGGVIEAKYFAMGEYETSYFEAGALMSFKKYEIYYPSNIADFDKPLPVVVFVNGTGVGASKYPALLKHMASWGFIAIGTEEEHAWNGFSGEMCVRYLEFLNHYEGEDNGARNVFFGKVDLSRIGITGHSQGGFGVVNAITDWKHKDCYKAAVILSCSPQTNEALGWSADATLIQIPTLTIGSTGTIDAALAPLESLQTLYHQIPENVQKVLARRKNVDHGQTLYCADGYVTAWFMYLLQGDEEAAKAFVGDTAEILNNSMYQDALLNLE